MRSFRSVLYLVQNLGVPLSFCSLFSSELCAGVARRMGMRPLGERDTAAVATSQSVSLCIVSGSTLGIFYLLLAIIARAACTRIAQLVVEDGNALLCVHSLRQAAHATPTSYEYPPVARRAIHNTHTRSAGTGRVEIIFCEGLLDSAGKHRIHGGLIQTGHTVR